MIRALLERLSQLCTGKTVRTPARMALAITVPHTSQSIDQWSDHHYVGIERFKQGVDCRISGNGVIAKPKHTPSKLTSEGRPKECPI